MTSHALPAEPSASDGDGGASIDRRDVNDAGAGAGCRVRKACVTKGFDRSGKNNKIRRWRAPFFF